MDKPAQSKDSDQIEEATLAAGCFWCLEAVLNRTDGVISAQSGYMGGRTEDPTYEQICTGQTGHAEVVRVRFEPSKISYEEVLDLFWQMHDPTTLNRQGADVGTQYRSGIFYHDEVQRETATKSRDALAASGTYSDPIVTEITPISTFYSAEAYHQNYYTGNKSQSYCRFVIAPKLAKLGME